MQSNTQELVDSKFDHLQFADFQQFDLALELYALKSVVLCLYIQNLTGLELANRAFASVVNLIVQDLIVQNSIGLKSALLVFVAARNSIGLKSALLISAADLN